MVIRRNLQVNAVFTVKVSLYATLRPGVDFLRTLYFMHDKETSSLMAWLHGI